MINVFFLYLAYSLLILVQLLFQILVVTKFETAKLYAEKNYFARVNFCTHRLTSLYSGVSFDVTPGLRGVVYFCGRGLVFLTNSLPKKRVRGENSVELLRNKLYKSVHNFIGSKFFKIS